MYPFPVSYAVLNGQIIKVCESKIGTSTHKKPGEIINIYKDGIGVSCSDGEIIITKLKPSGKKEMLVSDYLNGKNKEDLLGKIFEWKIWLVLSNWMKFYFLYSIIYMEVGI